MLRRHLFGLALAHIALWAVAALALWVGVDLADRTAAGAWPLGAWPLRVPTALAQVLPFAALAGTVHALVSLHRSGAILGARALGVRADGILRALLGAPAVVALVVLAIVELVQPPAAARWARAGRGPLPGDAPAGERRWSVEGDRLVRAGRDPLVVTLGGRPLIVDGEARRARDWPPPSTLGPWSLPRVALAIEHGGQDASAHRAETWFRPVVAASALLLPWIALPIALGRLRRGPIVAAAAVAGIAVVAYAGLVTALSMARAGTSAVGCAGVFLAVLLAGGIAVRLERRT